MRMDSHHGPIASSSHDRYVRSHGRARPVDRLQTSLGYGHQGNDVINARWEWRGGGIAQTEPAAVRRAGCASSPPAADDPATRDATLGARGGTHEGSGGDRRPHRRAVSRNASAAAHLRVSAGTVSEAASTIRLS